MNTTYTLLDSGDNRKLERFGDVVVDRPRGQAVWQPRTPVESWQADAVFVREGRYEWRFDRRLPKPWMVELDGLRFRLEPTDFGHVGVFPEHLAAWQWMTDAIRAAGRNVNVLNLFAYTGGATFAAARAGANVCHLDASKKSVQWARENAGLNGLDDAPIRWIADDAIRFLKREHRRDSRYDGIILDPPNYGRGTRQEVFKLDEHVGELLRLCRAVLTDRPLFVALTCHAQGYTPIVLSHLLDQMMAGKAGTGEAREMVLTGEPDVPAVPSGAFAGWRAEI